MNLKAFLKPTKWKLAASLILTAAIVLAVSSIPHVQICACMQPGPSVCTDYFQYLIYRGTPCHCACTSILEVLADYMLYAGIPFILFCLFFSAIGTAMPKGRNSQKGK